MYRPVAFAALRGERRPRRRGDGSPRSPVDVDSSVGDEGVFVDGDGRHAAIRGPEVTAVGQRRSPPTRAVRAELRARQRAWADEHGGGVIEGRDIGTVVFPDASSSCSSPPRRRSRAERRVAETGGDVDEVGRDRRRDQRDMTRADGPLREADGAVVVDTDGHVRSTRSSTRSSRCWNHR